MCAWLSTFECFQIFRNASYVHNLMPLPFTQHKVVYKRLLDRLSAQSRTHTHIHAHTNHIRAYPCETTTAHVASLKKSTKVVTG